MDYEFIHILLGIVDFDLCEQFLVFPTHLGHIELIVKSSKVTSNSSLESLIFATSKTFKIQRRPPRLSGYPQKRDH